MPTRQIIEPEGGAPGTRCGPPHLRLVGAFEYDAIPAGGERRIEEILDQFLLHGQTVTSIGVTTPVAHRLLPLTRG